MPVKIIDGNLLDTSARYICHQVNCKGVMGAGVAKAIRGKWPELALLHHVPNGGSRNKSEAARFKAQGVKAGVPDLCLPVARGRYHGMYIEMKKPGGRLSPEQRTWIGRLLDGGYYAVVAYGFGEAIEHIGWYMGLKNEEADKDG